jgi:putative phosphoesterase
VEVPLSTAAPRTLPPGAFIGIVADTHGLLRPEARAALDGAALVLHCGDVGAPAALEGLAAQAPLVAVRGNVDRGAWAEALPAAAQLWLDLPVGLVEIHIHHVVPDDPPPPQGSGPALLLAGHSHQWRDAPRGPWRHINPGSAGPRRFRLPVTLGRLWVDDLRLERVELLGPPGA